VDGWDPFADPAAPVGEEQREDAGEAAVKADCRVGHEEFDLGPPVIIREGAMAS
jgi:hypothetical protein